MVHLLPQDEFLSENIMFSTLIPNNDEVFIMLNNRFLAFDKYLRPLKVDVDHEIKKLLSQGDPLEIVQINSTSLKNDELRLLFETESKYYVFKLQRLERDGEYFDYSLHLEKTIQIWQPSQQEKIIYSKAKLTISGTLYQIIVYSDPNYNKTHASVLINGRQSQHLSRIINNIIAKTQNDNQSNNIRLTRSNTSMLQQKQKQGGIMNRLLKTGKTKEFDRQTESEVTQTLLTNNHEARQFDFQMMHDKYFVFKSMLELYYIDTTNLTSRSKHRKVDLELRSGFVKSIYQTQNDNLLSFVYVQNEPKLMNYIFVWDLEKNMEASLLELPIDIYNSQNVQLYKGVDERLNYYIPKDQPYIFDVRFEYPMNFFSGIHAHFNATILANQNSDEIVSNLRHTQQLQDAVSKATTCTKELGEIKISSNSSGLLGISQFTAASIQLPVNPLKLSYLEFLARKNNFMHEDDSQLLLQYLNFTLLDSGNNVLHIFGGNEEFLKLFCNTIVREVEEYGNQEALHSIYYALFPNKEEKSPFRLMMKEFYSPRCVDKMLSLLMLNDDYDYFMHFKNFFFHLLKMKSLKFERFFEECTNQLCLQVRCCWNSPNDSVYMFNHTQYISEKLIIKKLGEQYSEKNLEATAAAQNKTMHFGNTEGNSNFKQVQQKNNGLQYLEDPQQFIRESQETIKQKPVSIYTYEYGWLLRGQIGREFMYYLSSQATESPLFLLKSVQTIIDAQFNVFRSIYIRKQLLPFLLYFILVVSFNTILNPNTYSLKRSLDYQNSLKTEGLIYKTIHYLLGAFMSIMTVYYLAIDIIKLKKIGLSSYGIFAFIFHILILAQFIVDICSHQGYGKMDWYGIIYIVLSSYLTIGIYFMLLIHMRIFETFAVMINIIFKVLQETLNFSFIYILLIAAFGNAIFILAMLERPDTSYDKFTGPNIISAFMFIFNQAQSYDDTKFYQNDNIPLKSRQGQYYIYIYYVFQIVQVIIINVITLNLLVAILSEIYSQVREQYKSERFRAKCKLIHENEIIFNRKALFGKVKYIVKAELDHIVTKQDADTNSNDAKNQMYGASGVQRILEQNKSSMDQQFKVLKQKLQEQNDRTIQYEAEQIELKGALQQLKRGMEELKEQNSKLLYQLYSKLVKDHETQHQFEDTKRRNVERKVEDDHEQQRQDLIFNQEMQLKEIDD